MVAEGVGKLEEAAVVPLTWRVKASTFLAPPVPSFGIL